MKISLNWLKQYINLDLEPEKVAEMLTDCGLEVGGIETFQSVKGGLEGLVIGEVNTKNKHPNADKLSLTTVDVGNGKQLQIICGAPNVDAGQKVVVAKPGITIYPADGKPFKIKEAKIRGELSQGMICAEDEIGLGAGHDGIMVLDEKAEVGSLASNYFEIEEDTVFELDLTPNRIDGASHVGVARDLAAVLNCQLSTANCQLRMPSVDDFKPDNTNLPIEIIVEDQEACSRYCGVTVSGIEVKTSPAWLQNRLKAIGQKPINNVVDATNFVLHELGQPLHAFDASEISGGKVIVKKLPEKTKFTTLDEVERELHGDDLMICNEKEGMCIAGVFGGIKSGVTDKTKNIFLESAYFDPVHIRKTAKRHGLNTDASWHFERGADPNTTVDALKRAAMLIKELAGGTISSEIVDVYPNVIENFTIGFSYDSCDRLIGKQIKRETIKNILTSLEIEILEESETGLQLSVPSFKVDVQREVDVIEEVLRIYGYNNVEVPQAVHSSLSYSPKPDKEKVQAIVSDLLSSNGFSEIMSNSLTNSKYYENSDWQEENHVKILNPVSADLDILRQTLLFSGLEAIERNQNRQKPNLRFYEFGNIYRLNQETAIQDSALEKYEETQYLALFLTGRKHPESWSTDDDKTDFYQLKGFMDNIISRLGIGKPGIHSEEAKPGVFDVGLKYKITNKVVVEFGQVNRSYLKKFDIKQPVFCANFNWDNVIDLLKVNKIKYSKLPKYPSVRRDLALLVDKSVQYSELEKMAFQTEKKLLKSVNLFDVYEGENIEKSKKSYAIAFTFQDEEKTLTDKHVDGIMQRLISAYTEKIKAVIR